ncbi:MAG: hypothetical protein LBS18_01880 [Clostridiales bacterium]|nr:hypothetical protein [Clostridiales bacterium]
MEEQAVSSNIWHDENNWTHIDWSLEGVTSKMLDWFWCNMEKGDLLWHPNQHLGLTWMKGRGVVDLKSPINSIHIAPQKWGDGKVMELYIRMDALENVPDDVRDIIKYDHVVITAGDMMGRINEKDPDFPATTWRVHQWQSSDDGVVGMSSGMNRGNENDIDSGMIWAKHGSEEVGNWEEFLPRLYELYKVIESEELSPCYSFKLAGKGRQAKYTQL